VSSLDSRIAFRFADIMMQNRGEGPEVAGSNSCEGSCGGGP
jgi:hypothetical protein